MNLPLAPDVEWTVTIHGQPLAEMAPATREALLKLMELAREQAEAILIGTAVPAPSLKLIDRMRGAIAGWDTLAKAEAVAQGGEAADVARERAAREAFEDAFNLVIGQFEKEYPNG